MGLIQYYVLIYRLTPGIGIRKELQYHEVKAVTQKYFHSILKSETSPISHPIVKPVKVIVNL